MGSFCQNQARSIKRGFFCQRRIGAFLHWVRCADCWLRRRNLAVVRARSTVPDIQVKKVFSSTGSGFIRHRSRRFAPARANPSFVAVDLPESCYGPFIRLNRVQSRPRLRRFENGRRERVQAPICIQGCLFWVRSRRHICVGLLACGALRPAQFLPPDAPPLRPRSPLACSRLRKSRNASSSLRREHAAGNPTTFTRPEFSSV